MAMPSPKWDLSHAEAEVFVPERMRRDAIFVRQWQTDMAEQQEERRRFVTRDLKQEADHG